MRGTILVTGTFFRLIGIASYAAEPSIGLAPGVKADGVAWINFADPAGSLNVENGITDGEATVFDCVGNPK